MICLCHGGAYNGYLDQAQASPVSVLMQPAIEKADGVGERLIAPDAEYYLLTKLDSERKEKRTPNRPAIQHWKSTFPAIQLM